MNPQLQLLIDKDQIRDVLYRYARGTDRRDKEMVRSCYFEDATDEHGEYKGRRDEYIDWWYPRNGETKRLSHLLGNCFIELASDTVAIVETYFAAISELDEKADGLRKLLLEDAADAKGTGMKIQVFGRYLDKFEKRGGEWRIARRQVVYDLSEASPLPGGTDIKGIQGCRDESDAVYAARSEVGLPSH